jgi:hypothetical protein
MRRILTLALLCLFAATAVNAATIVIVNNDGVGEGFNDPTAAAPVGGNPGLTVGQQRLDGFQHAADIWGALLPSAVTIQVQAQFNPQTSNATSAVLGSAGPISVFRDFVGAEFAGTWYHVALANKLNGSDLSVNPDINATFNSNLNGNPACLGGTGWYYGFDGNEGSDIELLPVVLHELGHGLGFSTLVGSNGVELNGFPDVYETFIRDNPQGTTWPNLTAGQRAASAVNTGNLVWDGAFVTAHAPLHLGGTPTVFANSPGTLPAMMTAAVAGFGGSIDETGVTGDVVLVDDGIAPNNDGCTAPINGGAIAGNIALIDRGACNFTLKVSNAQAAGAIAVIVANNVAGAPFSMGGTDPAITIPAVMISLADGNLIKAELGGGVNVTLALDPNDIAGADANGRVQLYAPNPYEGGSSVSHFDIELFPNALMEPAINDDLSDDVDLTLAHFTDIGWLNELPTDVPPRISNVASLTNYPNPFNPSTTLRFNLPAAQTVELAVFDVQGRLVRSFGAANQPAGVHEQRWDGRDNRGMPVASGVYYARMVGERQTLTRKIVLLK